jgi:ATP-binding cassette subfamily A (ABC1) protein 3
VDHIKKFIPTAQATSDVSLEVAIQLPIESTHLFPKMLESLSHNKETLGIQTYGVSVATLEDVFLRVAEEARKAIDSSGPNSNDSTQPLDQPSMCDDQTKDRHQLITETSHKRNILWRHFKATLTKRFRIARRDTKTMSFEFYLPAFLIIFSIVILKIRFTRDMHPQTLDWSIFQ